MLAVSIRRQNERSTGAKSICQSCHFRSSPTSIIQLPSVPEVSQPSKWVPVLASHSPTPSGDFVGSWYCRPNLSQFAGWHCLLRARTAPMRLPISPGILRGRGTEGPDIVREIDANTSYGSVKEILEGAGGDEERTTGDTYPYSKRKDQSKRHRRSDNVHHCSVRTSRSKQIWGTRGRMRTVRPRPMTTLRAWDRERDEDISWLYCRADHCWEVEQGIADINERLNKRWRC